MTRVELVNEIFEAIPSLSQFHDRGGYLFDLLDSVIVAYFKELDSDRLDVGPLHNIHWPKVKMGGMSSWAFFTLSEMLLYQFYKSNSFRYSTFFDVGAHVGIDSLVAVSLGYVVEAFEPDPLVFVELEKNGDLFRCHNIAISDKVGGSRFVRVEGNTTASHLIGARKFYGPSVEMEVTNTTFEEIGHFPDLMKINVEGHEGVIVRTIPHETWQYMDAFVEIHNEENRDQLYDYFQQAYFDISRSSLVRAFSQKIGWRRVQTKEDLPINNKEGYIFISGKEEMPWQT